MEKTDEELVKEYNVTGDTDVFEVLVRRYGKSIYNFIYRYVGADSYSNDLAQDTFVKMWKNIKKFDGNKRFKTWIFQIAKNTALDWLKSKHSKTFSEIEALMGLDEEYLFEVIDTEPLPDELVGRKELKKEVEQALVNINPEYRAVVSLHIFSDLTFQEISDITGVSVHTVKSRYRRALIMLKKHLMP
jgi:RNA polymerase sigma-70 factor (ECF subfamily)